MTSEKRLPWKSGSLGPNNKLSSRWSSEAAERQGHSLRDIACARSSGCSGGSGTHREMTLWRWPNQKKRALAHKRHSRLLAVIETCDHSCINLCLHLCHQPSFPAGGFCVCFAASALFRRMKVRRTLWATPEPRVPLSIKLTATPTHQRSPLPSRPGVFAADVCTHPHMLTLVITDFHVPFFLKCFCGCICPCTAWKLAWSPFFCPKSKSWAVTTFASPDLISSNKRTKTFKPRAVGNSSTHPVH